MSSFDLIFLIVLIVWAVGWLLYKILGPSVGFLWEHRAELWQRITR